MKNSVGKKIKFIRTKIFDYTQDYMAKKLNISQNAYSKIENGHVEPKYRRLVEISCIFNMSVSDMLRVNENYLIENSISLSNCISEYTHQDINPIELKNIYERLLIEQKEKYEAQINVLKMRLNKLKNI